MTTLTPSESDFLAKKEPLLQKSDSYFQETLSRTEIELQEESSTTIIPEEKNYLFRRWLILGFFCFLTFVNGATWVAYATIIEEAKTYYSVSETQILWFIWQFNIIYVIISFPCSHLIGRSLFLSVILGSITMSLGAWVRYFAFKNYMWALFGQTLVSVSTSFIISAPNTIANLWFPEKERFLVITMGSYSNCLGSGFGYLFSSQFVDENPNKIESLLFVSAIVVSVPVLLSFSMLQKKNSESQQFLEEEKPRFGFYQSLKILFRNKRYMLANLAFSICNTNCWNLLAIIDIFLQNNGISSKMVGIVCLILVLSGFLSSLLATFFLRVSSNPRKHIDSIIKILYLISFLAFVTISVQVIFEIHINFIILSIVFLGIGAFGLAPFNCEALEDLGKPIQEAISVNGFYFLINLIGLPLGFISTLPALGNYGLWTLSASVAPCAVYILFFYRTSEKKEDSKTAVAIA